MLLGVTARRIYLLERWTGADLHANGMDFRVGICTCISFLFPWFRAVFGRGDDAPDGRPVRVPDPAVNVGVRHALEYPANVCTVDGHKNF